MFVVLGVVGGLFGGGVGAAYAAVAALGVVCIQAKSVWPPIMALLLSMSGFIAGKIHPVFIPYVLVAVVLACLGARLPPGVIGRKDS